MASKIKTELTLQKSIKLHYLSDLANEEARLWITWFADLHQHLSSARRLLEPRDMKTARLSEVGHFKVHTIVM